MADLPRGPATDNTPCTLLVSGSTCLSVCLCHPRMQAKYSRIFAERSKIVVGTKTRAWKAFRLRPRSTWGTFHTPFSPSHRLPVQTSILQLATLLIRLKGDSCIITAVRVFRFFKTQKPKIWTCEVFWLSKRRSTWVFKTQSYGPGEVTIHCSCTVARLFKPPMFPGTFVKWYKEETSRTRTIMNQWMSSWSSSSDAKTTVRLIMSYRFRRRKS